MKFLLSQLAFLTSEPEARANLGALAKYFAFLFALVTVYAVLFHVIKLQVEGEPHSWVTGIYWTLVVMTTLGFGDITFTSDLGRMFSVLFVVSGTVLMLIILPFTFIQFFYAPWLEARDAARAPRQLPETLRGHVLLTGSGPVDRTLAQRLQQFGIPYAILVADVNEALALDAEGL